MKQSESLDKLMQSLITANQKIVNPKNTTVNPFFKKKYAPLGDILTMVRPILTENGLSIVQNISTDDRSVSIETGLYHISGQYIISDKLQMSSEKATPQGQGSAITYGRRYQLSAFLNIASEDDDDANHATKEEEKEPVKHEKEKGNQKAILEIIRKTDTVKALDLLVQQRTVKSWTESELKEQNDLMDEIREFIQLSKTVG